MVVTAGVDVSKASLDVSISEGSVIRFDNTVKGIGKLLKHLKEQDAAVAVCEATGGYERLLVSQLRKTEIAIHVAHPSRVRAFAKACGYEKRRPIRGTPRRSHDTDRYFRMNQHCSVSWSQSVKRCVTCSAGVASLCGSECRKRVVWIRESLLSRPDPQSVTSPGWKRR